MKIFNQSAPSQFMCDPHASKIKLKSFSKLLDKEKSSNQNKAHVPTIKKQVLIVFKTSDDDKVFQKYCQRLQTQKTYLTCSKFIVNNIDHYRQMVKFNKCFDYWLLISQKNYLIYGKQMENIKNFIIFGDIDLTTSIGSQQKNKSNINDLLCNAHIADFTSNINLLDSILQKRKLIIKIQSLDEKQEEKQKCRQETKKQYKNKVGHCLNLQSAHTYIQNSSIDFMPEQSSLQERKYQQSFCNNNQKNNISVQNCSKQKKDKNIQSFPLSRQFSPLTYCNVANLVGKGSDKQINLQQYDKYIENGITVYRKIKTFIQPSILTNKISQKNDKDKEQNFQNQYDGNYLNFVNPKSSINYQHQKTKNNFNQIPQNYNISKLRVLQCKTKRNSQELKKLLDQRCSINEQYPFFNHQRQRQRQRQRSSLNNKSIRQQKKSSSKKMISSISRSKLQKINREIKNPRQFEPKKEKNNNQQYFSSTSPNKNNQTLYPQKRINKTISSYPKNYNQNQIISDEKLKKSSYSSRIYQKNKSQSVGIQCDFQQIKSVFRQLDNKVSFTKQNSNLPQSTLASLSQSSNINMNNNLQKLKNSDKQNKLQNSNNYPSFGQKKKSNYKQSSPYDQQHNSSKIKVPQQNLKLKSRSYMTPFTSSRSNIHKNVPKTANQYYFKHQLQLTQRSKQNQKPDLQKKNIQEKPQLFAQKEFQNEQKGKAINQLNVSINQISILYLIDRLKKDTLLKQLQKIVCEKDSIYTFKNPQQLYNQMKQSKDIYEFTFIFNEQIIPFIQNEDIFVRYPWCYFVNIDQSLKQGEFALKHNMIDIRQICQLSDIIDAIVQARKHRN